MASKSIKRHNETLLKDLEVGDAIEFPRNNFYSHWALYAGDGKVIHLAGDENDGVNANFNSGHFFTISGVRFNKANVKIDNFWDVVLDSFARKNNSQDRKKTPHKPQDIIEKAMSMLGTIGYNLLWCNCEHFVNFCRYGDWKSSQVDTAINWTIAGAVGAGLLGLGLAWLTDDSDKKKTRGKMTS